MSRGVALVTGCSSGIGRASALALADGGWTVAATARRLETLDDLASRPNLSVFRLDVADAASIDAAIEQVTEQLGPPDVLVNNAGYAVLGALEEVDLDAVRRQFEVNVFGLLGLSQRVLPGMRERRRGRIVNISSTAGQVSNPFSGAYASSKFSVEAISDALRVELRPWGVRVVLVQPGPIETNFVERAHRESLPHTGSAYQPWLERMDAAAEGLGKRLVKSADVCARVVVKACEAKHPRARYRVTFPAHTIPVLQRVLPGRAIDALFAHMVGLRSGST